MTTVFVCGGTGFIGEVLVRQLVAEEHEVHVLTRADPSEKRARRGGGVPVKGDLLVKGPWQEAARRAEWVVHLAQPQTFGGRVTRKRAEAYRDHRRVMDDNLLDALDPAVTKRIVYVAGTSYYGNLGTERRDETATPKPRGWGPYIAPAVEALGARIARGLPIVVAFPGYVYGDGSWFREYVLAPLHRDEKINAIAGRSRFGSPIHVEDCARALGHLLRHGAVGERYFLVDDRPVQWSVFYDAAAKAAGRVPKLRQVPPFVLRLLVGSVVTDSLLSDAVLSNAKLKALGFELGFPTIDDGLIDVVKRARPFRV